MFSAGQYTSTGTASPAPIVGMGLGLLLPARPNIVLRSSAAEVDHHASSANSVKSRIFARRRDSHVLGVISLEKEVGNPFSVQRFFKETAERAVTSPYFQSALAFASSHVDLIPVIGALLTQGAATAFAAHFGPQLATIFPSTPQVPEEVEKYLGRFMSAYPVERYRNGRALARYLSGHPRLIAATLKRVGELNIYVQGRTIRSLGGLMANPDIQDFFKEKLQPGGKLKSEENSILHEAVVYALDRVEDYDLKRDMYIYALGIFYGEDRELDWTKWTVGEALQPELYVVHRHAINFLKDHFDDDRVAEAFIEALGSKSKAVSKEMATFLADKITDPQMKMGYLKNQSTRLNVIRLLKPRLDEPRITAAIRSLLDDPDETVAIVAVLALAPVLSTDEETFLKVSNLASAGEKRVMLRIAAEVVLAYNKPVK